jgi:Flp pilus assembly protein protease CpaA
MYMYVYEIIALITSVFTLSYASIEDVKKREISDKVWLVLLLCGVMVRIIDIASNLTVDYIFELLISIGVPTGLFLLMYYLGLLFGGADAKAFICLALTLPKPLTSLPILSGYLLPLYVISIFDNSILLSLTVIPVNMAYNIYWLLNGHSLFDGLEAEPLTKKVIVFFTCRKIRASVLKSSPNFHTAEEMAQNPDGTTHRRIKLMIRLSEDDGNEVIPNAEYILAHYYIPLIVFITLGLITSILLGDLIMLIVKTIMTPFM